MPSLLLPSPNPSPHRLLPLIAAAMHSSSSSAGAAAAVDADAEPAISYHVRTKHGFPASYARGPRGLDWANQPNPFLRFASPSHPRLSLPLPPPAAAAGNIPYALLFSSFPSSTSPLSLSSLSSLLFHSLALSAWKSAGGNPWSLRVNPSSGNLHPTEAHLLLPSLPSTPPSPPLIAHYSPKDHSLEPRALLPSPSPFIPDGAVAVVVFSSILWREAWKYGERAFRYCNHDVGHAVAAVAIAAAALGWDARLLDGLGHSDLERLLGILKTYPPPPDPLPARPVRVSAPWAEAQHPDCALLLFPAGTTPAVDYNQMIARLADFDSLEWIGKPNSLSKDHVVWDVIYRTAAAVVKPGPAVTGQKFSVNPFHASGTISPTVYKDLSIQDIVRRRRSAVDMDGMHVMSREAFYQMLLHCLPSGEDGASGWQGRPCSLPFRALTWDAEVHMALFVHRVTGLPKGIYFLVRNEAHFDSLRQAMRPDFKWVRPEGCPPGLPLYLLAAGDCQSLAMQVSCHQEIASHGCFSLGMIARFEPVLREKGPWMYPRLFWETGVLGQVLYLEAHAVGIAATGIGCYFDDAVHDILGLKDLEFQSLYHFTVGAPIVDKRIMSLPAYPGPGIDA